VIGCDQFVDRQPDRLLVEGRVADIEIQAAFRRADLAAGYAVRHHRAQQMQTGMHAHMIVAALPVEPGNEPIARFGDNGAFLRNMDDVFPTIALERRGNANFAAVAQDQHAAIARLAAAGRVEYRPVENDAAKRVDGDDRGLAFTQIGIGPE